MSLRKLNQQDLVGKSIKSFDNTSVNVVKLTFTDETTLELWADEAVSTLAGMVPGIFVEDEHDWDSSGDEKLLRKERLEQRSLRILNKGGRIFIRRIRSDGSKSYLHSWTNIAAGPDKAEWTTKQSLALEIFNLEWAFAMAPLYKAKVVVAYPQNRT